MNTYTKTMNPKKKVQPAARNNLFPNTAILAAILTLVIAVTLGVFIANHSAMAAEDNRAVPYSNALEMQYARPWLEAENKPVVAYSNALELQYARPWLEAENKPVITYGNALELQYAQPWLDKRELSITVTRNVQEESELNCSSTIEMLYACKFGFGLP